MRVPGSGGRRLSVRSAAVIVTVAGIVLAVGIGTASAGDRGWWGKRHHPHPSPSASGADSPTPGGSETLVPPASTGASGSPGATTSSHPAGPAGVTPPAANATFDYQIGDPYTLPKGVGVVSRDHSATPAAGVYNICYVNGFQAQPEELSAWKRDHDALLLRKGGAYVIDKDWNEVLLDISTDAKREALTAIVGAWMDECAAKGFKGVEVDNLDSWTRSDNTLTQANAVAYAKLLTGYAHGRGLAIGQKNTVEIANIGKTQIGFDFGIAESCADYEISHGVPECQGFVDAYGAAVIVIEYDRTHFKQACSRYGKRLSIVLRDRDVTAPGSSKYAFASC